MKDLLNCPNCGAPITKDFCPYCGSVFLDWATFSVEQPTFVKIQTPDGKYHLVKLGLEILELRSDPFVPFYDDVPIHRWEFDDLLLEASFRLVPFTHYLCPGMELMHISIDPKIADPQIVSEIIQGKEAAE